MSEEKAYSVIGRVEIGTDEYRDLIESAKQSEVEADKYRQKYWAEQTKVTELEKRLCYLETYREYVTEKCNDSYKLWKMETTEEEDDF